MINDAANGNTYESTLYDNIWQLICNLSENEIVQDRLFIGDFDMLSFGIEPDIDIGNLKTLGRYLGSTLWLEHIIISYKYFLITLFTKPEVDLSPNVTFSPP